MLKMSFAMAAFFSFLWPATILATNIVKDVPYIKYGPGLSIAVTSHCYEKGYIRPKQYERAERRLKKPITLWELIDLGHGRTLNRVVYAKMAGHIIKSYRANRDGEPRGAALSEESFEIPPCEKSKIAEKHGRFRDRKATPLEVLVYGALYQEGVSTIVYDDFRDKSLDSEIVEFGNRKTISFDSPNCFNGYFNPYALDMMTLEDMGENGYLGGEGSGHGRYGGEGSGHGRFSGGGKLQVRLNIPTTAIHQLRSKPNWVEKLLKLKPRYHEYLVGGKDIPESIVKVKCKEKE